MASGNDKLTEAAGCVVWRPAPGGIGVEIALVHRPKYDDWSVPKGKLVPGEAALVGALREVAEETGVSGVPGRPVAVTRYLKDGTPKRVRYWAMRADTVGFVPGAEVDQLMWLPPREACLHLSPDRDRPVVEAFALDVRPTRPLVIVRHGSAGERSAWTGDDRERPLDDTGRAQAAALLPILQVLGVRRVLSADVLRCLDTVGPYASAAHLAVESEPLFSESGFGGAADLAVERLLEIVHADVPAVVCSQGKVIPPLLARLCGALGRATAVGRAPVVGPVPKGGFVVVHLLDRAPVADDGTHEASVVAIDTHPPGG